MSEEPTAGEGRAPAVTAAQPGEDTELAGVTELAGDTGLAGDTAAAGDAGPAGDTAAAETPGMWSDPRLPWQGKPRPVDIACWAAITLSGLYYLALLPFRAALVGTHPVILEVLNGSTEAIVAAAAFARTGHGSLLVVLLASIPGLMKFDLIYWWAGRLWGERVIHLFAGRRRRRLKLLARVDRWGRWFTWPAVLVAMFLPIPSAIIYAMAGWTGMSLVTFLILDIIGSLAWAGMLAGLGYALGQHAVSVAQAVSRYGLWISIGIVILVVAGQVRGARSRG